MNDYKITTGDERQMNMMSLETFTFDIDNTLDYPLKNLINEKKELIKKSSREHDEWIAVQEKNPLKFEELEEVANQTGHSLHFQLHNYIMDILYLKDELLALFQVKIIYAFSHFEINLKRLLSSTYSDESINKRSNWNSLIEYLDYKSINLKELKGYKEVDELRLVNNSLKHAYSFDRSLSHIAEFKEIKELTYVELEKFYERVEKFPNIFLTSIITEVFKDMYEFDNERLERVAKSLALRMDNKIAKVFIDEFKKHY